MPGSAASRINNPAPLYVRYAARSKAWPGRRAMGPVFCSAARRVSPEAQKKSPDQKRLIRGCPGLSTETEVKSCSARLTRFSGRSSDFPLFRRPSRKYAVTLEAERVPLLLQGVGITAAGPSRTFTGFPFHPPKWNLKFFVIVTENPFGVNSVIERRPRKHLFFYPSRAGKYPAFLTGKPELQGTLTWFSGRALKFHSVPATRK